MIPTASPIACSDVAAEFGRAQAAWRAFVDGDFLDHADEAEAQFRIARRELAEADSSAKSCTVDRTALARVQLHFEIDLVVARRSAGATASLQALSRDLTTMRDLGLARDNPDRFRSDAGRFRELQAETHGTLVIPPPAVPFAPANRAPSCATADTEPYPLAPITPAAGNPALLRSAHSATAITVLVGPQGNVLATLTTASSGAPALDQAVLNAVHLVTFAPAHVNCHPAQGEYRFTYTFPQL